MNKLDSIPSTLTLSPASHFDSGPVRRLIVLVPDSEADTANAARMIWELANAFGCHVQFLGLCKDATQEPSLRRQLVTLSAMVQDGNLFTDVKVEIGHNWLDVVRPNLREGDVIACFAEQRAGLTRRPLSQILESNLNTSVYILSGLYQTNSPRLNWISTFTVWAGSIAFILGFFWLQTRIVQLQQDWAHMALLYLSILVEIGLISGWNSLF